MKKADAAPWAIGGLGAALLLFEYFHVRVLTWDEASVALTIAKTPFSGLDNLYYGPLKLARPYLFAVIEKVLINAFGSSELILRLIPILSALTAIFLFWLLAKKLLSRPNALVALGMYILCAPMIGYGSRFREYTLDVALTIGVYLVIATALSHRVNTRDILLIGMFGAVAVWLSNSMFFVLAGAGAVLFFRKFRIFWLTVLLWAGSTVANYKLLIANISPHQVLFSDFAGSFPDTSSIDTIIPWYAKTLMGQVGYFFGPWYPLFILLLGIGAVFLLKKMPLWFLLFWTPAAIALVTNFFGWYPFTGRQFIFLLPAAVLTVAYGLQKLTEQSRMYMVLTVFAFIGLGIGLVVAERVFTIDEQDHLTDLMRTLVRERQRGDVLYLYNNTDAVYLYIARRLGLTDMPFVTAHYRTHVSPLYLSDVQTLLGKPRVWALFTHDYNWGMIDEEKYIVNYFLSRGKEIGHWQRGTSDLYLFDLTKQ